MTTDNAAIATKLRELADLFEPVSSTSATPGQNGWGAPRTAPAAAAPAGARPWDVPCPKCGGVLRVVPAGVSRSSGRPYNAFIGCATCDYKGNMPGPSAAPMT